MSNYPDYPALRVPALFWDLPVEEKDVPYICPIVASHQPHGFRDAAGQLWLGILTSDGLKRKMYVGAPAPAEMTL
jgi:hypothetical protein